MFRQCAFANENNCVEALKHVYINNIKFQKTLRCILSYTPCRNQEQQQNLQQLLVPVINGVLLKCADGNRRTSQLSLSTIVELARGQAGELAIGREIVNPGKIEVIFGAIRLDASTLQNRTTFHS